MWINRLALRWPYSTGAMAIFILFTSIWVVNSMTVGNFPVTDIPVVTIIWSYPCLSATSRSVGGVEHIESQSQQGVDILKVYFQKGTDIGAAVAQMSATASTVLSSMPPGTKPPLILAFNASNCTGGSPVYIKE